MEGLLEVVGGLNPDFDDSNAKIYGCNEADFNDGDFQGKIAVISRGHCTFALKLTNSTRAGAKAVVIFNNADGVVNMMIYGNRRFIFLFNKL